MFVPGQTPKLMQTTPFRVFFFFISIKMALFAMLLLWIGTGKPKGFTNQCHKTIVSAILPTKRLCTFLILPINANTISLNPHSICSICDIKFLDIFLHAMNTCHNLLSKNSSSSSSFSSSLSSSRSDLTRLVKTQGWRSGRKRNGISRLLHQDGKKSSGGFSWVAAMSNAS